MERIVHEGLRPRVAVVWTPFQLRVHGDRVVGGGRINTPLVHERSLVNSLDVGGGVIGGVALSSFMATTRSMLELSIVISVWYAASAVAGSTTRHLLSQWPAPLWLCTVQFVTASCVRAAPVRLRCVVPTNHGGVANS